jgi:hypothetical protein
VKTVIMAMITNTFGSALFGAVLGGVILGGAVVGGAVVGGGSTPLEQNGL